MAELLTKTRGFFSARAIASGGCRQDDAAQSEHLLALRRPGLVEHAGSGEMDDGVCAVDDLRPIAGFFRGPRGQLDLAGAAAARGSSAQTASIDGLSPAQDDDVVPALAEGTDERMPDETRSSGDYDSQSNS